MPFPDKSHAGTHLLALFRNSRLPFQPHPLPLIGKQSDICLFRVGYLQVASRIWGLLHPKQVDTDNILLPVSVTPLKMLEKLPCYIKDTNKKEIGTS